MMQIRYLISVFPGGTVHKTIIIDNPVYYTSLAYIDSRSANVADVNSEADPTSVARQEV